MRINEGEIKNYEAIQEMQFKFQDGFNLIMGKNGQGKSGIFKSFGFSTLDHLETGKIEDACNWEEDYFSLYFNISHLNKTLISKNVYKRKGSNTRELSIEGEKEVYKNSDAVKKLSEYFDPILCKNSIINFQGSNDLVESTPTVRRELLKKIYDLSFTIQIEKLENEKALKEEERQKLLQELAVCNSKVFKDNEEEPIPFDKAIYNQYKVTIEELKLKISTIEKEKKAIEEKKNKLQELQKSKVSYETEITTGIQSIDDTRKNMQLLQSFDYSIFDVKKKEEIQALDTKKQSLIDRKEKGTKLVSEMKFDRLEEFDSESVVKAKKEYDEILFTINQVSKEIELCKSGKCPTCKREFNSNDIQEKEKELLLLNEKKIVLDSVYNKLKNEEVEHKKKVEEENKKTQALLKYKNELSLIEKDIESTNKDIASIEEKYTKEKDTKKLINEKDLQACITSIESIERTNKRLQNEVDSYNTDITNIEKEINSFTDISIEEDKRKVIELESQIKLYDTIISKNELIKEQNKKLKEEKEKNDKRKVEIDSSIMNISKGIDIYLEAIGYFKKDFPNYIITNLVKEIEEGMNEFIDKAYEGRYTVKIQENKNGIEIVYGPKEADIKRASGSEKNLFNVALKMAFTKISGLGILILDEIDAYMSDEVSKATFSVIKEYVDNGDLQQVFIITHHNDIKDMMIQEFGAKAFLVDDGRIEEI